MNYTTDRMDRLWHQQNTLDLWHEIEIQVMKAQARAGIVPKEWVSTMMDTPSPMIPAWEEQLELTHHEVTAYLRASGLEHVHIGLTSSDLVDTANALRANVANEMIRRSAKSLVVTLGTLALEHQYTPRLARTHGQAAVPDSFGRRLGMLAEQVGRCQENMTDIPGKLSGPVGSYRQISREVEQEALAALGFTGPEDYPICSQIVPRDYHSRWAWGIADLVSACAAIGLEVRLLSHSGVAEVVEWKGGEYTGSSAMPGKVNPNYSERLGGLARLARSAALAMSEGIEQWHDRDLVHSSVERVYLPMLCGLGDHATSLATQIVENLQINTDVMEEALEGAGRWAGSHDYLTQLLLKGTPYQEAVSQTT